MSTQTAIAVALKGLNHYAATNSYCSGRIWSGGVDRRITVSSQSKVILHKY